MEGRTIGVDGNIRQLVIAGIGAGERPAENQHNLAGGGVIVIEKADGAVRIEHDLFIGKQHAGGHGVAHVNGRVKGAVPCLALRGNAGDQVKTNGRDVCRGGGLGEDVFVSVRAMMVRPLMITLRSKPAFFMKKPTAAEVFRVTESPLLPTRVA